MANLLTTCGLIFDLAEGVEIRSQDDRAGGSETVLVGGDNLKIYLRVHENSLSNWLLGYCILRLFSMVPVWAKQYAQRWLRKEGRELSDLYVVMFLALMRGRRIRLPGAFAYLFTHSWQRRKIARTHFEIFYRCRGFYRSVSVSGGRLQDEAALTNLLGLERLKQVG